MNLGPQIGPFPLGGWVGIGVAGVGVALLAGRRKSTAASGSIVQNPASVQPVAFDQAGLPAGGGAGGGSTVDATTTNAPGWADVFDAYRAGVNDQQANAAELAATQPTSWQVPTTVQPVAVTTPALAPASIPSRIADVTAPYVGTAGDVGTATYLVGGVTPLTVDSNYAELHSSDLALATDPYLNPDLRQAAIDRLGAAG